MIALSTLWNPTKTSNGLELLSRIRDIGFDAIELDCHLPDAMLEEMRPKLGNDDQVVSIHNFCPIPRILPKEMAGGDAFLLSSTDKEERGRAVEYANKTIELGDSIECRVIVCHFGHVDITDPTDRLIDLYNKGEKESSDYELLLEEAGNKREFHYQRNLDAVFFSLEKLIRRAEALNVFIGIENRREFRQIPNVDEMGIILSEFGGANIGYWHNTGYAQIQGDLDIADHEDLLKKYSERMIGIHLNDSKNGTIHLPPGEGDVDFAMIKKYLPEDAFKVMQVAPETSRDGVMEGISHLEDNGIA